MNLLWSTFYLFPNLVDICLTHRGLEMHICISKLTIIGSDNGLLPGRHQAIIWTNVGILLIGHLGTNFSEMLIKIHTFLFTKIHLKMLSGKWRPFCLGLNVLNIYSINPINWSLFCPHSLLGVNRKQRTIWWLLQSAQSATMTCQISGDRKNKAITGRHNGRITGVGVTKWIFHPFSLFSISLE